MKPTRIKLFGWSRPHLRTSACFFSPDGKRAAYECDTEVTTTAYALEAWERMTFAGLGVEGDNPTPRLGRKPKLRMLSPRHGLLAPFEYPHLYPYRRPYRRVRPVVLELSW